MITIFITQTFLTCAIHGSTN